MNLFGEIKETTEKANSVGRAFKAFENNQEGMQRIKLSCINEHLEGKVHDDTTVEYKRKVFLHDGMIKEGVFPQFESKFNMKMPEYMWKASDTEQFKYCTKMLSYMVERNPVVAKQFTSRQLAQIRAGEPRISGLTWHHNEIPGKMQLVDANEHQICRHRGGRSIWGGGQEYR